jgi:hypothetical protein
MGLLLDQLLLALDELEVSLKTLLVSMVFLDLLFDLEFGDKTFLMLGLYAQKLVPKIVGHFFLGNQILLGQFQILSLFLQLY